MGKLCVICSCAHLGSSYADDFNIFMVGCIDRKDLDLGGFEKIEPNIRVRGFGGLTCFCYLNSTLYAFENEQQWVYTYELGEGDATKLNYVLEKSMVDKSLKYQPSAIPTPDGKMLVFSIKILFHYPEYLINDHRDLYLDNESDIELEPTQGIYPHPFDDIDDPEDRNPDVDRYGNQENVYHSHLELFDPASQCWEELPQLMMHVEYDDDYVVKDASDSWIKQPFKCSYSWDDDCQDFFNPIVSCFSVNACSFISNNTLLVHVSLEPGHGQFFTFDMHGGGLQPYQGWIPTVIDPHKFLVVSDLVYFSASDGYLCHTDHHIHNKHKLLLHPYLCVLEESSIEMEDATIAITLLDNSNSNSCPFVRVCGGKHPKTWESSLLLDILSWDGHDGQHLQCRASYHLSLGQISKSFGVVKTFLLD